jgi:hypothetical protein
VFDPNGHGCAVSQCLLFNLENMARTVQNHEQSWGYVYVENGPPFWKEKLFKSSTFSGWGASFTMV